MQKIFVSLLIAISIKFQEAYFEGPCTRVFVFMESVYFTFSAIRVLKYLRKPSRNITENALFDAN